MSAVFGNLDLYWEGFRTTLLLLIASGIGSLVLGTIVAAMRISPVSSFRGFAAVVSDLFRNTPLTMVFFFMAFVMPKLGAVYDFRVSAVIALTLYTMPFVAESLRSGINGVAPGQAEAARAIGLRFSQVLALVILPQGFRMAIPPLINTFIALAKNTSVAGGFFVFELFSAGKRLANEHGDQVVPILLGVAFFYLVITIPLGQIAERLERRAELQR